MKLVTALLTGLLASGGPPVAFAEAFSASGITDVVPRGGRNKMMRPQSSKTASVDASPRGFVTQTHMVSSAIAAQEAFDEDSKPWIQRIEGIVYISYLCNVMALSLPVLLVPIAATEAFSGMGSAKVASAVAGISSVATLGGAVGKFTNGFICQALGSYTCSKFYLLGLAACSAIFSMATSSKVMGLAFAGMEFFASIQWAALAVMLSNYYDKSPIKLAAALTALGLSSTSGQIAAKTLGMTLASTFHWRVVAQVGALTALIGSLVVSRAPRPDVTAAVQQQRHQNGLSWTSVKESLRAIFGSKLFWALALAHSMAFVARGTDRILGIFFEHMASLPTAIAGGLTLSITLGLVHGLVSGSKRFSDLPCVQTKKDFLAKRYGISVAATLGLALTAGLTTMIPSKLLMAVAILAFSGTMASNVAFQYFQFPSMIAKAKFAQHSAIVISFLDGFGFLLSAPIFATTSKLVPAFGWSSAWIMLATLFGGASILMLRNISHVLEHETNYR